MLIWLQVAKRNLKLSLLFLSVSKLFGKSDLKRNERINLLLTASCMDDNVHCHEKP